ncbi:transposable element Tcb2 transposase [Trichonephila clavipes]|nr:transposable element Tcb2 transposase [Trichonephila clavipes]
MDPTCQQGIAQAGGGSVMVWGVCSWRNMGPLIRIDTTLIAGQCDTHTSLIATEWLQEHSSEFRHFRWPPKSPNIYIIEYIWDALQRAVQKRSPPPLTPIDLWTALQDSWCHLPPPLLQTIESIPRRFAAFLRARGGSTRY